jgi:hypothetical protein
MFPAESWVYRIAIWARWASRAGDGGWSGSREGQRRPVALRPPVDGGLVGNRGDLLPAVATLGRAATPYGARIADAGVGLALGSVGRSGVEIGGWVGSCDVATCSALACPTAVRGAGPVSTGQGARQPTVAPSAGG